MHRACEDFWYAWADGGDAGVNAGDIIFKNFLKLFPRTACIVHARILHACDIDVCMDLKIEAYIERSAIQELWAIDTEKRARHL